MRVRILSFDCANKSLAYTFVTIDFGIWDKIREYTREFELLSVASTRDSAYYSSVIDLLHDLNQTLISVFQVHKFGSLDVLGGASVRDVDEIDRMQNLADTLNSLDIELTPDDVVLIEDQPEAKNTPSYAVQSGLQMYYVLQGARVILTNPRRKNHVNLDPQIHMSVFIANCVDTYSANKMHSCANFLRIARNWKLEYMTTGLQKYDDVADSFMQALAWFIDMSLLNLGHPINNTAAQTKRRNAIAR